MNGEPIDPRKRIILAADVRSEDALKALLMKTGGFVGTIKIGLEAQTAMGGPKAIDIARDTAAAADNPYPDIMYDGKFKDIPATMAAAAAAVTELGVWAFTVHASASVKGMQAAAKTKGSALMLAVTVLTSMDDETCRRSYGNFVGETVLRFADLALEGGADGLVCSPRELTLLAQHERFNRLLKVVPGVRPEWAVVPGDDQPKNRVMTPNDAIRAGANRLVMGRPITGTFPGMPGGPAENVARILKEIEEGLHGRATA